MEIFIKPYIQSTFEKKHLIHRTFEETFIFKVLFDETPFTKSFLMSPHIFGTFEYIFISKVHLNESLY